MPEKTVSQRRFGFETNQYVVYPTHGVGRIVAIEEQEIAGCKLELFVINFEKDKMTLRVPTSKSQSAGMRKLSDDVVMTRALDTLRGRARVKRTMWSRRAQEYEAKINSGDLITIAEVVRDLYRSDSQPEQSYSERQLYEAALDRMAREIAAAQDVDESIAIQKVAEALTKAGRLHRKHDGKPEEHEKKEAA
jgi:CarD family transcriptional regulator